jgi:hypothetical protein
MMRTAKENYEIRNNIGQAGEMEEEEKWEMAESLFANPEAVPEIIGREEREEEETEEFTHVTSEEAAEAILDSGFSLDTTDSQGGSQLGVGIYLSQAPDYWAGLLNLHSYLRVTVRMDRIVTDVNEVEGFGAWLEAEGWMKDGGPTEKANEFIAKFQLPEEAVGRLQVEWLAEIGYDGLWDREFNNLVIWNLDAIKSVRR